MRGVRTEYVPEEESEQELKYVNVSSGTLVKRLVDARAWLATSLIGMVVIESVIFLLVIKRKKKDGMQTEKVKKIKKKRIRKSSGKDKE